MTLHLLCWASAILHLYIEIFSNALDSISDNNRILYHFRIQYPHVNYKPFFFSSLSNAQAYISIYLYARTMLIQLQKEYK